jgi:excisionase family DNA binding protein
MVFHKPPALAKQLGVAREKIIEFIRRGELRAINLSEGVRPRWRISEDDWQTFLAAKSNQRPVKKTTRRKTSGSGSVIEFYK